MSDNKPLPIMYSFEIAPDILDAIAAFIKDEPEKMDIDTAANVLIRDALERLGYLRTTP